MTPLADIHPGPGLQLRGVAPGWRLADFRLIAFDMDSTLIDIETVDEVAEAVGCKAQVAAITEAAMRGDIRDCKESLRQRVALLRGVPVPALQAVYDERLQLNPGVETLVAACKRAGLRCILVSDGANDLPMMQVAGLSVACHAKPLVRQQAMVAINEGGLDRLLEVLR